MALAAPVVAPPAVVGKTPAQLKLRLQDVPAANESVNGDEVPDESKPSQELWSYFSAGLLLNLWGRPAIDSAEIRGGRVRVLKTSQFGAGVGLQAYYPLCLWTALRSSDDKKIGDPTKAWFRYSELGIGPYVGVSLATSDIIDTVAVGLALSMRRKEGGIRFGFGLAFDPDARHLASDFKEGARVPVNTTDVQYIHEMAVGGQFMLSFTPGFSENE
jgi:hypothetical protein